MATMAPQPPAGILHDVRNLVARLQHGEVFRHYLRKRRERVALLALLCIVLGVACASGVILFVLGLRPLFVLAALLASPFVLMGSTVLLLYVAFSWLENLALAHALHHPGKAALPPVPWVLATVFVFVPFLLLVMRAPGIALALGVLAAAAPIAYLRFERQKRP